MGTDYSDTIFGHILGLFKTHKCVFCKDAGDLSRVTVSAYEGYYWYYFHESCLTRVLDDPDTYKPFVDMANEIQNEINYYKRHQIAKSLRQELSKRLRDGG